VGYNIGEGLVSVVAGYLAGSIALVSFGLDSFVESLSGGVALWRFWNHGGLSAAEEARRERIAIKLVGWTFFILGTYVGYESLEKLYFHEIPGPSLIGIIIAGVSLIFMPILYYVKFQTGKAIHSQTLLADARQTLACAFLSLALLLGLTLNYFFGLWQADPVIALIIAAFLWKEGYNALTKGKL
jgi:divalent metal cation (Fe/Co/Zn/Cd) transporter